jgi:hypothetical protein
VTVWEKRDRKNVTASISRIVRPAKPKRPCEAADLFRFPYQRRVSGAACAVRRGVATISAGGSYAPIPSPNDCVGIEAVTFSRFPRLARRKA